MLIDYLAQPGSFSFVTVSVFFIFLVTIESQSACVAFNKSCHHLHDHRYRKKDLERETDECFVTFYSLIKNGVYC